VSNHEGFSYSLGKIHPLGKKQFDNLARNWGGRCFCTCVFCTGCKSDRQAGKWARRILPSSLAPLPPKPRNSLNSIFCTEIARHDLSNRARSKGPFVKKLKSEKEKADRTASSPSHKKAPSRARESPPQRSSEHRSAGSDKWPALPLGVSLF
jgi:hypothetical protein